MLSKESQKDKDKPGWELSLTCGVENHVTRGRKKPTVSKPLAPDRRNVKCQRSSRIWKDSKKRWSKETEARDLGCVRNVEMRHLNHWNQHYCSTLPKLQ